MNMVSVSFQQYNNYFLYDESGRASPGLRHLLELTGISIPEPYSMIKINQVMQTAGWKSSIGVERWDMQLKENLKAKQDSIIQVCFEELGMSQAVFPMNTASDGIIFLGATFKPALTRTKFYIELRESGKIAPSTQKLWALTGERKLSAKAHETKEHMLKIVPPGNNPLPTPDSEYNMLQYIFHYLLPKNIEIEYIYSGIDGQHTRATTNSTMIKFLEVCTMHDAHLIVISNQPYVKYQEASLYYALALAGKTDISLEVVGSGVDIGQIIDKDNLAAILLDTVAKTSDYLVKIVELSKQHHE